MQSGLYFPETVVDGTKLTSAVVSSWMGLFKRMEESFIAMSKTSPGEDIRGAVANPEPANPEPANPEPLKFAYWVPAFGTPGGPSNGYVASRIEMRTGWDLEYNVKLGQLAEQAGVEYALTPARFSSAHLADGQNEAVTLTSFLLARTEKLKVIFAVLTGCWHPGVMAKMLTTADNLSNGRAAINIITGWHREEYTKFGIPWLEHDERYRLTEEFVQVLKGCMTQEEFTFKGDFFRINEYTLSPKAVQQPYPEIFQAGSSTIAKNIASRHADWSFNNGGSVEVIKNWIDELSALAASNDRRLKFGMNGFVIARDTEKEARETYEEILRLADWDVVKKYSEQVKQAGKSTTDGVGLWTDSKLADLVQWNNGFKPNMIGTPEQVAERIVAYRDVGLGLLLLGFLHFQEEMEYFGKRVMPLIRELEAERAKARLTA